MFCGYCEMWYCYNLGILFIFSCSDILYLWHFTSTVYRHIAQLYYFLWGCRSVQVDYAAILIISVCLIRYFWVLTIREVKIDVNPNVNVWMWRHDHMLEANLKSSVFMVCFQRLNFSLNAWRHIHRNWWCLGFNTRVNMGI